MFQYLFGRSNKRYKEAAATLKDSQESFGLEVNRKKKKHKNKGLTADNKSNKK